MSIPLCATTWIANRQEFFEQSRRSRAIVVAALIAEALHESRARNCTRLRRNAFRSYNSRVRRISAVHTEVSSMWVALWQGRQTQHVWTATHWNRTAYGQTF